MATKIQKRTSVRSLKCAIYVRVSTEKDEQKDSPEHQVAICREMARRRSHDSGEVWLTPDDLIYEDRLSGTDMFKRPAIQKLIRDAEQGKFDLVIFKSISRFARNTADSLTMLDRLKAAKVRVISYVENYDSDKHSGDFIFTIHAGLAQQGSEKISIDVLLGNMAKAGKGQWNGICPDGYSLGVDKRLVPNDRAPIIQYIYDLFTKEHLGTTNIVQRLNREGYKTAKGVKYQRKAIYNILTNRVYVGDVVYGKRTQEVYYDENNRRRKRTVIDEEERNLVITENAHSAIITREQFDIAQKLFDANKKGKRDKGDWVYLLSGLIRCKSCGRPFNGKVNHVGTRYYRCTGKVAHGAEGCNSRGVRALDFESAIVDRIRERVAGIDFDSMEVPTVGSLTGSDESVRKEITTVENEIEKLTTKANGLLEKNLDGVITDEMFGRMNAQIEAQIRDAETRRVRLAERLESFAQVESSIREIEEAVTDFLEMEIHEQANRGIGRALLYKIVNRIEIRENGEVDVYYNFEKAEQAKSELTA